MEIFILLLILFPAIVIHEYAHGWSAYHLGDPTAKEQGRLTLNPLKHVDPVGTILVPGAIFVLRLTGVNIPPIGWAKPVPVNFRRLRHPKGDMMLVALAGPVSNVLIALTAVQLIKLDLSPAFNQFFLMAVFINLLLAVFNMVPIPPLDGSRVVMAFLPNKLLYYYAQIERFGILIVVVLLNFGLFEKVVLPVVIILAKFMGSNLS